MVGQHKSSQEHQVQSTSTVQSSATGIVVSTSSAPAAHHATFGNVPGMHRF